MLQDRSPEVADSLLAGKRAILRRENPERLLRRRGLDRFMSGTIIHVKARQKKMTRWPSEVSGSEETRDAA